MYKESEDFKNDATKAGMNSYIVGFNNYRDKVTQAYSKLDLSGIVEDGASPKGKEEEL